MHDRAPVRQGKAYMALGAVLGQLAAMSNLPQKDRADYHDEALQALQQAYACDPDDVDIMYNLAHVQVRCTAGCYTTLDKARHKQKCRQAVNASNGIHAPSQLLLNKSPP